MVTLETLCRAASEGDLARLEALPAKLEVPSGADSPLCFAAMYGQLAAARLLLDRGAEVNHRGGYGRTPLLYAATKSAALTKLVLERGADLKARNDGGDDALEEHLVRSDAEPEVVDVLLAAGLDFRTPRTGYYAGRTHLMLAASCGRVDAMEKLLAAGADPSYSPRRHNVLTSMVQASERHRSVYGRMLSLIAHSGVDPNLEESLFGTTLLMAVCKQGDLDAARVLVERGADVDKGGYGTPLTMAEESGNQALVDYLLEAGATPTRTPLPPEVTKELDEADEAARAAPRVGAVRARRAATLMRHGFHAHAAVEAELARRLGEVVPPLTLENPPGVTWELIATPADEAVTPRQGDGWVRGVQAKAQDGRVAPVVLVVGRACARCDEKGEETCTSCNGSGWTSGQFSDTDDLECPTRQRCRWCSGTKYQQGVRFSKGACKHLQSDDEVEFAGLRFRRCRACGLLGLGDMSSGFACAACGLLDCGCAAAR